MHTYMIHITLLALCYTNVFQPLEKHSANKVMWIIQVSIRRIWTVIPVHGHEQNKEHIT
jgi:hypothetical protein